MKYKLQDLIDIEQFQLLQDRLNNISSFPSAIIDNEGNILTATAWQDICTKFHRADEQSAAECIKSDRYVLSHLHEANPSVTYVCPHGLVDNATPIIIEGVHYGNFFTGQFFLEKPGMDFFKAQATKYGFDKKAYFKAVKKVPVWSQEQLNNYIFFIKGLIEVISGVGLKNLKEIEVRKQIKEKEEYARTILSQMFDGYWVLNLEGKILDVNDALCRMLGYAREEMLRLSLEDVVKGESPELIAGRREDIIREGSAYFEAEFRHKDGSVRVIDVAVRYLTDRNLLIGFHRDISGRKKAEEALRESERRLNTILDNVGAAIFIKDKQYRYTYANRKVCEIFGRSVEEIHGKTDSEFFSTASVEEIMRSDRPVIERGETVRRQETELTSSDKMPHTYWTVKLPLRDSGGSINGLCGISTDITERKLAEDAIRNSGEKFRMLFNSVNDSILIHDFKARILEVNDVICRLLGYRREELLRMSPKDFDTPEAAEKVPENLKNIIQKGVYQFESVQMTKDGRRIPVDVSSRVIDFEGKRAIISVCRDITERKRSEDALLTSEERLRQSVRVSNLGIFDHDHRAETLYWSPRQREIYGWGPDETVTLEAFIDCIYSEDRDRITAAVRRAHDPEGDGLFAVEHRIIHRDGSIRRVTTRSQTFFSDDGEVRRPVRTIGAVRDITAEEQAKEKIQESEQFIRNILDTVDEGFIVIDRDFRILTANTAYCNQAKISCSDVIGRHCYEISHNTLSPCYRHGEECAVRQVFETGEPHTALHRHSDAQGSFLYVETKAFPIKDNTGAVTSVIETINNITEKHLLEEEQLKSQKLEAIGTLAGGIAHDFNNLFQGVFGFISMAKRMYDQKEKSLDMLEQAEQALHMSVSLASQLLTFSKGGKPVTKTISLRPLLESSAKFSLSGSRVNYRLQVDEGLGMVEADEGQIGQVIQNLVLNAEQAMPMGGTIVITAKNVRSGQKGLSPVLRDGNYVELSIKDSGIGIPEQFLPKIFDPYFTTKDKGSGLGLATSYSIVKNHGGFIDVKSNLGKGTTFFVYLPALEAAGTSPTAVSEEVKALRKARILLMDDEDVVRNIAGVMIRSLGHEVELVENGTEAVEKYRESMRSGEKFDIVIMDLTVRGGMGGEEAMEELLQIDPDIKALVSSGYSDGSIISEYKTIGFKACLTKPYDIVALNGTLNSLLD